MTPPLAVILAAGLGTRMKSGTAKVLHRVAGRPLLFWPVELARASGVRRVVAVLGHQLETVRAALDARYGQGAIDVAEQRDPKGTGHALQQAMPALASEPAEARVLVLSGDVPLLTQATVTRLLEVAAGAPVAVVTMRPPEPRGYGRMVRDAAGRLQRIVEEKDASAEVKAVREVNAGIYAFELGFLRAHLTGLSTNNAQGELYITDLIARAAERGEVPTVEASAEEVAGANDRVDLSRLDASARRLIAERWMREGVTMVAPDTVSIDADVTEIGRDSELGPGVALRGAKTKIGAGVRIDIGCVITDSTIADGVNMKPYCVITDAKIGPRGQIGPFSHCRPGTDLAEDVHLGNFVETKKARLGKGSKANHLAYLGDADIGAKVNVGAGTITCNYDGKNKFVTTLEDGVFIGSDSQLVAPVRVGKDAYVGAGTTVTKDVPAGALAVSRTPQHNIEGYVERKKRKEQAPK